MTQIELDVSVAAATGESLTEVERRGFSLADPDDVYFDPEPDDRPPLVVDWDELERLRCEGCIV
jgi:hypothetical protein